MIALPTWSTLVRIATPEAAVTATGVSPISSVRNVMVKVHDTASFIAKAIEIHGDKYDYSQTVWFGANQTIQIICREHGLFTLKWAASHYSKKGSGCQKCSGCEVKVRSTEDFVRVCTEIHGGAYDYSQTVFIGSNKPVKFICKKHGLVGLSEAQSHYRNKKPCGCRRCGDDGRMVKKKCVDCDTPRNGSNLDRRGRCSVCAKEYLVWCFFLKKSLQSLNIRVRRRSQKALDPWLRWADTRRSSCLHKSEIQRKALQEEKNVAQLEWSQSVNLMSKRLRNETEDEWTQKARRWARGLRHRGGKY